jgi:uncharacterized membrane protein YphA (DoxX/SURF4 family)
MVPLYLRLAIGIPELASSLEKLQNLPAFVALWHEVHLPAAKILAPVFAAGELVGALLLLAGWQTRTVAALFVAELLSEILLTKQPLVRLSGWTLEWQSLCVALILARIGAGPWSLDWRSACRRGASLSGESRLKITVNDGTEISSNERGVLIMAESATRTKGVTQYPTDYHELRERRAEPMKAILAAILAASILVGGYAVTHRYQYQPRQGVALTRLDTWTGEPQWYGCEDLLPLDLGTAPEITSLPPLWYFSDPLAGPGAPGTVSKPSKVPFDPWHPPFADSADPKTTKVRYTWRAEPHTKAEYREALTEWKKENPDVDPTTLHKMGPRKTCAWRRGEARRLDIYAWRMILE